MVEPTDTGGNGFGCARPSLATRVKEFEIHLLVTKTLIAST
jgi:hypothetical protein